LALNSAWLHLPSQPPFTNVTNHLQHETSIVTAGIGVTGVRQMIGWRNHLRDMEERDLGFGETCRPTSVAWRAASGFPLQLRKAMDSQRRELAGAAQMAPMAAINSDPSSLLAADHPISSNIPQNKLTLLANMQNITRTSLGLACTNQQPRQPTFCSHSLYSLPKCHPLDTVILNLEDHFKPVHRRC
jgi:hypothetical protein